MNQMVFGKMLQSVQAGEAVALITVVSTKGSTPRKAGATMLVKRDGQVYGTIGGGCSEAEVKMRALQALDDLQSCTMEVRMLNDAAADEGMVCGGIMEVFIQIIKDQ